PADASPLIIVDEAHAFRNSKTRRYKVLKRFARSSKLVLLTATPVNNSIRDLHSLLKLFCADAAFADVGVGSFTEALLGQEIRARDIQQIKRAVIIRRTRSQVRCELGGLRFPDSVRTSNVDYDAPIKFEALEPLLERLTFPGRAHAADLL